MSTDSLRSIVRQTQDITAMLVENGGVITPEIEAALIALGERTPSKIDGYAHVMDRMDNEAEYWEKKAKEFSKVAKACKAVSENLWDNIKFAMETLQETELKGRDVRFTLTRGKPQLVVNEALLDSEYVLIETVKKPDRERISKDLMMGKEIEGATLMETKTLRRYANSKGDRDE